jgi:CheY-like chemotaxis protein
VFPIVFSLVLCALTIFSFGMLRNSAYRSESALLNAASEKTASRISAKLQAMLDLGQQFLTMLLDGGEKNYTALKSLAEESLAEYPYIDSITIAPGAIIRYSFPEDSTSASIGHDLLDNPERMHALVAAVRKKKAVLQGPDISAEGEELAFLRIPVFRAQELWGFVSLAIDVNKMMENLHIKDEFPGVRIAFTADGRALGDPGKGTTASAVFWGDDRALPGYVSAIKLGADDAGWAVHMASMYPATRAVWWGLVLIALSLLGAIALLVSSIASWKRQAKSAASLQKGFVVNPFMLSNAGNNETGASGTAEASHIQTSTQEQSGASTPHDENEPGESGGTIETGAVDKRAAPPEKTAHVEGKIPEKEVAHTVSVLVVDDSEVNRELLLQMLMLKGYEAQSVPRGELALGAIKERGFDVLLIDCIMPGMDGYALAGAIRRMTREAPSLFEGLFGKSATGISRVPLLIAMSPRHDPEEVGKCVAAGFDSLLIKPFTMTSLDQKIQETLNNMDDKASER